MIDVQIVDDHKVVVASLSKLINESATVRVTKVYYDLDSCRQGLKEALPDVLLLDIGLPDGDGVDFCGELKSLYPALRIIMLTTYKEFSIARRALYNGALGYILKNAECEEVFVGIEVVSGGGQFLCEEIDLLLQGKNHNELVWLSNREREILHFIADGFTTKEIADMIFRNAETVKTYRRNLLVKLEARNTAELVKIGYIKKLID